MFPLKIKYKREINSSLESSQIIDLIEKELRIQKIDKIERTDLQIDFKNSFSNEQGKWHLMASIDKGYFKLDKNYQS